MAAIRQPVLPGIGLNHIERSIEIMRMFEPEEGYYLAFSGGKDSTVLLEVAKLAGVKFDAHYSVTGIDPPELVKHIREHYPEVAFEKPKVTWPVGIMQNGLPQRNTRWCCRALKENGGEGRRVLAGIRAEESSKRSRYGIVRHCQKLSKDIVYPILSWTAGEAWEFIRSEGLPYCCLYDQGFSRIGCVPCPFHSPEQTQDSLSRWPHVFERTRRHAERYWAKRKGDGKRGPDTVFATFDEWWEWWLARRRPWPGRLDEEPDQPSLFGPD